MILTTPLGEPTTITFTNSLPELGSVEARTSTDAESAWLGAIRRLLSILVSLISGQVFIHRFVYIENLTGYPQVCVDLLAQNPLTRLGHGKSR